MKTILVTKDALLSTIFNRDMLIELAVGTGAYELKGATQMADAKLSKPSKLIAGLDCPKLRTTLIQKLEVMRPEFLDGGFNYEFKCNTNHKAARSHKRPDAPKAAPWSADWVDVECQAEWDYGGEPMNAAADAIWDEQEHRANGGAPRTYAEFCATTSTKAEPEMDIGKAGANNKRKSGVRTGKHSGAYEIVKVVKATNDEAKEAALRQHIWTSATVEEYYKKADAKYVSKTGRVVTATDELNWAFKNGWIKPVQA